MIKPNKEFMVARRKQLELTQRDVAWRVSELGLKLNDNHYSRIERGLEDYSNIKLETAFGIARALEATLIECFSVEFENDIEQFPLSPEQRRKLKADSKQTIKAALGQKLKEYRNKQGLPARHVADAIEVHPSYIFQVEKGNSSFEVMQKVANFYGFDLEDLNNDIPAPSK
ncbi:helix-turn-helix transcriptional regulator [Priestia megaterium]|uniref:helix-turn-helix domain-containing protein n=1 Tax=Priestia megaterium TaxID=1404 RepID=UPI00203BAE5C|nr:helix-turn-helix transcriptional regulator [Priestia megaterium]MCM3155617.1 helix-turn-helix transcriptional regulator [Priestia megaterium]